jgi:nucleolar protein 9
MENLFLFTLNELEGNLGYLMTDRFASHVLRVLLTVFSGQSLTTAETNSVLRSKKKEKISVAGLEPQMGELKLEKRQVPEVFQTAIDKIIRETVSGLDTTYLRSLATHPTGNPVLQLLLELELSKPGKGRENENSILKKLLPDDPPAEGTESASFVNGLLYDPVGSRLLEAILKHAPGKTFKMLYRSLLKERLGSLARNETAGYVVIRALERLSKQDLEEAVQLILPQIGGLVERSRTVVIKALIERCAARGVDTAEIAKVSRCKSLSRSNFLTLNRYSGALTARMRQLGSQTC